MAAPGRSEAALIAALAAGALQADAARAGGVSERTVRRRLQDPAFQQAVAAAQRELVQRAVALAASGAVAASATLLRLLRARSEFARLGAARAVLQTAIQGTELQAQAARLEALEARIEELGGNDHARVDS